MSTAAQSEAGLGLQPLPRPDREFYYSRVKRREGTIKSMRKLNYDTVEFTVKCEDEGPKITAQAGQYATIRTADLDTPRAFSFTRAPENEAPDEHTFLVRLVHGGRFSGWLFGDDRTGERVTLSGPLGTFTLDASDRPLLCVAGGSGMSAIKALLEHAANEKVARDCLFLYGARQKKDLYYEEEMRAIQQNWNPNHKFQFVQVLSEEPSSTDWEHRGLVTDYLKKSFMNTGRIDVTRCQAYLCGPPPMVNAAVELLRGANMPPDQMKFDKFEDSTSPAPVIDNTRCVLCDECLYVKPVDDCIVEVSSLRSVGPNTTPSYDRIDPGHTAGLYYSSLYIDSKECIRCFSCVEACPVGAISVGHDRNVTALRPAVGRGV